MPTAPSSHRDSPVAGIVLAAGRSRRMGRNKLLIEIEGEPLVRRVVGRAIRAGLDPVLVVTGYEPARVEDALHGLTPVFVLNPDYDEGKRTSIQAGVRALPEGTAAAALILADMPYVTAEMMAELVEAWRNSDAPFAASRYGDVVAPPIVYGRAMYPDILATTEAGAGKRLVMERLAEAVVIDWPEEVLLDIDDPADLEMLGIVPGAPGGA